MTRLRLISPVPPPSPSASHLTRLCMAAGAGVSRVILELRRQGRDEEADEVTRAHDDLVAVLARAVER